MFFSLTACCVFLLVASCESYAQVGVSGAMKIGNKPRKQQKNSCIAYDTHTTFGSSACFFSPNCHVKGCDPTDLGCHDQDMSDPQPCVEHKSGDGFCTLGETFENSNGDCQSCSDFSGDPLQCTSAIHCHVDGCNPEFTSVIGCSIPTGSPCIESACGDGFCSKSIDENFNNCPQDCSDCPSIVNNIADECLPTVGCHPSLCDPDPTVPCGLFAILASTCVDTACGDGYCSSNIGEDVVNCSQDCGFCSDYDLFYAFQLQACIAHPLCHIAGCSIFDEECPAINPSTECVSSY